ncbi:MAG: hypothetical protein JXP73_16745 [Deltaproteobacteria bacterium]|nr:hypothetical protein [Deltaproteobacteria bacterium]
MVRNSKPGALLVDFPGNAAGPVPARSVAALDEAALRDAVASRQEVVLLFENQDPRLPIVVGLLAREPGAALLGSLLQTPAATPAPAKRTEARVDGKRVVIEGEQEVTLRCGDATITLRRDGKLILRGAYIETTAKGLNRIRGGSVKIN